MSSKIIKSRIKFKQKIRNDLVSVNASIARKESTIERNKQGKVSFSQEHINKLKTELLKLKEDKLEFENRIIKVTLGEYDDIISSNSRKATEKNNAYTQKTLDKKKIRQEEKESQKSMLKQYRKSFRVKATTSQLRYHKKRYFSIVESIPSYMKDILKNMPNNKGFIFKGVHLYGEKAPDPPPAPVVLFDRKLIHIIYKDRIELWKKGTKGKHNKELISTTFIKKKS